MKKINYRLVYNRKKSLNNEGKALVQVEAYLESKKIYFSTHIYLYPEQWDTRHAIIIKHPQEEELNRMLQEFMLKLQWKELKAWKEGKDISLSLLKDTPSHYKHHPAYGAQNETYMSRSAEKWVKGLCFNELGVGG